SDAWRAATPAGRRPGRAVAQSAAREASNDATRAGTASQGRHATSATPANQPVNRGSALRRGFGGVQRVTVRVNERVVPVSSVTMVLSLWRPGFILFMLMLSTKRDLLVVLMRLPSSVMRTLLT